MLFNIYNWRNLYMNIFEIKQDFYLNNKKIKIISGAVHYFRIVPNIGEID